MCGIFGFIGSTPNTLLLQRIARLAGTRGCHSHGIAWIGNGNILTRKGLGKIDENTIFNGISTNALIGHCRLSTSGAGTIRNAQPILANGAAIAHNGNIPRYKEIAASQGITMQTDNDSEVFLHLICRGGLMRDFSTINGGSPYACLLLTKNIFVADCNKMPLYVLLRKEGYYFCSRSFDEAKPMTTKMILSIGAGSQETRLLPTQI